MQTPDLTKPIPADATDAEREAYAAAHRERYLAAKLCREAAREGRLIAMLTQLDRDYERPA